MMFASNKICIYIEFSNVRALEVKSNELGDNTQILNLMMLMTLCNILLLNLNPINLLDSSY